MLFSLLVLAAVYRRFIGSAGPCDLVRAACKSSEKGREGKGSHPGYLPFHHAVAPTCVRHTTHADDLPLPRTAQFTSINNTLARVLYFNRNQEEGTARSNLPSD